MFYKQQIEDASRLADQKPRNYHAWSFRHWIVSRLSTLSTVEELDRMGQWCRQHVSDHSGWNHRQHTLNQLVHQHEHEMNGRVSSTTVILAEFEFVSDVMAPYSTHEALWCHRRYVMQRLLEQVRTSHDGMADVSPVLVRISQVAGRLSNAEQESPDAATLRSAWDETRKTLSRDRVHVSSVARATLCEIEIAWKCQHVCSRRYAAWCLARLRAFLRDDERRVGEEVAHKALQHELGLMETSLHKQLTHEDSTLENLWLHLR